MAAGVSRREADRRGWKSGRYRNSEGRGPMKPRLVMRGIGAIVVLALGYVPAAGAQFAVIDVAAIVQEVQEMQSLAQQVETAREQLSTAQDQLSQARAQLQAMTGGRGMEQLLTGVSRNYLPRDWADLSR